MLKLNKFEKNLLSEFKSYVSDESPDLELDFRTHVYLENEYGGYPTYDFSIAEIIIDCIFSFFDKHNVNYAGRYNKSMMIESLRTRKLNEYLVGKLSNEIPEDIFDAMKVTEQPSFKIEKSFIDSDEDNPCLCIDIVQKTQDFICTRLSIGMDSYGAGTSGFINIQFPITNESQIYVAGANWTDEISMYHEDDLIFKLVDNIIDAGNDLVSRRDYELEIKFGTSNIKKHNNGLCHGFYNGLSVALLENTETNEAYVTFECVTTERPEYFPCKFKTFDNLQAAYGYIQSHCDNYQTSQDFGISNDIFDDLYNQ